MTTTPRPEKLRLLGTAAMMVACVLFAAVTTAVPSAQHEVFVSPTGSDAASGLTPTAPVASLRRARDLLYGIRLLCIRAAKVGVKTHTVRAYVQYVRLGWRFCLESRPSRL